MNMRPKRQRRIDCLTAAAMLVLAVSWGCSSESAKPAIRTKCAGLEHAVCRCGFCSRRFCAGAGNA